MPFPLGSDTTATSTASTYTNASPISPFSSYSGIPSEPTSDEVPDLGAFTTVFRALNEFQPTLLFPRPVVRTESNITTTTNPDYNNDDENQSTVWNRRPIQSYLHSHTTRRSDSSDLPPRPRSASTVPDSNVDEDTSSNTIEIEDLPDVEHTDDDSTGEQLSLGYLNETLAFIAAERQKLAAQREAFGIVISNNKSSSGTTGSTSESVWRTGLEPRRKRRRKRNRSAQRQEPGLIRAPQILQLLKRRVDNIDNNDEADEVDADDSNSNSSPEDRVTYKTSPATPRESRSARRRKIKRTKSTPSLMLSVPVTVSSTVVVDPTISRLRTLASKLRAHFPTEAGQLRQVLANDMPDENGLVDPRGPPPSQSADAPVVHVFIDLSNILIGLLTYMKRHPHLLPSATTKQQQSPQSSQKRTKHLSHAALVLILERGRSVTRRVIVTSSPLYQPMETAISLGYEVRIYARVPQEPGEFLRKNSSESTSFGGTTSANTGEKKRKGGKHSRKISGSTSAESNELMYTRGGNKRSSAIIVEGNSATNVGLSTSPGKHGLHMPVAIPGGHLNNNNNSAEGGLSTTPLTTQRIRYREQGVDELLQLKIHDALAQYDGPPPPGSTIVLATGDGNAGQFSDDGFLGPVRVALRKGWNVELYAWEEGLSKAWRREFGGDVRKKGKGADDVSSSGGGGGYGDRFRIMGMERFATDLMEV